MVANHSKFTAIEEEEFLSGTRVILALNKVGRYYLKKEIRREARQFLQEFVKTVLSTVVARSIFGQGISSFCPAKQIDGDNHAHFQLYGLSLDGFLGNKCLKGSDVEPRLADYQSFMQEQRQLKRCSTRSLPNVGIDLTFFSLQAGFRARRHLFKICIVINDLGQFFNMCFEFFVFC